MTLVRQNREHIVGGKYILGGSDSKVILVMPRFRAYFASGTPHTNPEHGTVLQAIKTAKRLWDEYLTWRFRYRPKACDDLPIVLDRSELGVFDRSYHATPSVLALLSPEGKMHLKHARRGGSRARH